MNATTHDAAPETTPGGIQRIDLDDCPELSPDLLHAELFDRLDGYGLTDEARDDAAHLALHTLASQVAAVAGCLYWLPTARRLGVAPHAHAAAVRASLVGFVTTPPVSVLSDSAARVVVPA
jgi:hypothetical protein